VREYAFDVKMFAVVRIAAETRKKAEAILGEALDCADLNVTARCTLGEPKVTEASVHIDDEGYPYLFEVDGIDVDNDESEADTEPDEEDLSDFDGSG
jgi:hypothetical protein